MRNHPARHDGVKAQYQAGNDETDDAGQCAQAARQGAWADPGERLDRVRVSVAAEDEFGHKRRIRQDKGQDQVDDQKRRAAIAGGLSRKAPDVAESDGAAGRRHNESEA